VQYFICALISPDFDDGDTYDMVAFQEREGRTYITAVFALMIVALVSNYAAGAGLDIRNWADSNVIVVLMLPPVLLALFVRARWAQIVAPVVFLGLSTVFPLLYYPALR
jgi:hypothetical protein